MAKTICAKPGYIEELLRVHAKRAQLNATVSRKDVAGVVGSLFFLNHAFHGSLAYVNPLIAFLRAGGDDWKKHDAYSTTNSTAE